MIYFLLFWLSAVMTFACSSRLLLTSLLWISWSASLSISDIFGNPNDISRTFSTAKIWLNFCKENNFTLSRITNSEKMKTRPALRKTFKLFAVFFGEIVPVFEKKLFSSQPVSLCFIATSRNRVILGQLGSFRVKRDDLRRKIRFLTILFFKNYYSIII